MLNVSCKLEGFDEFLNKIGTITKVGIATPGLRKFAQRARQIAVEGTPIGDDRDEHRGLMKQSWEQPMYQKHGNTMTATISNLVDYGMAENYGHVQTPGLYVPAIDARLVHEYVPGTYALEDSMQKAELEFSSIIKPEVLKMWNEVRTDYYDRPGDELIDSSTFESYE